MPLQTPQTILVTGASQGIGRELVLQLAAQGHTVIAWARSADLLAQIASERIHVAVVDLADTAMLRRCVATLLAAHPALSGVIHNAAIQVEHDLIDTTPEQVQIEIAINLTAPIVITQLLLPHLKQQTNAFVCNISSALALAAKRSSAVYCATKAGLHLFSDSLRAQLSGTNVAVIEIMPPTVKTRMTAHRNVPKMTVTAVAELTITAIAQRKQCVLLGKGKLLGVLLYLVPPLAKKMMLKF
jgi:short-subunit dehydrogenase involved in D-alanine esterification of teichoic acids